LPAIFVYALLSIPFIGAYAMFALGISVIYRASRVLNLAHGAMAMIPAYLLYSLVGAGVPVLVGLPLAVASGAVLGVAVERVFVRRLRPQGATAQTVGTVAVTGLLIALAARIWGTTPLRAPKVFPDRSISIGNSSIGFGDIGLFGTAIVVSAAFFWFFTKTSYGLALRGAAQNRRAASLMGIDPDLAAASAWALGGALAGLAGILLAAVTNLDTVTLTFQVLPAFVAALIGGLESLTGALWGAGIAGLSFGIVPYFSGTPGIGSIASLSGSPQLALAILALAVMAIRGRRIAGAEASESGLSAGDGQRVRRKGVAGKWFLIGAVVLIAWPWIVPFSVLGTSLTWIELTLAAASLVILTGYVGQISLAQASFVGIAALITGMVARGWGLGFPVTLGIGAVTAGVAATILGMVALRVRGLYLAVATLIFAWMSDSFLFRSPWLGVSGGTSRIDGQQLGRPGGIPYLDLTEQKTLFYVFLAVVVLTMFTLANLRETKTGRAFFAIRGSEMAASSLGIDVTRYKLIAFAMSGVIAGIAGNLIMMDQRSVEPSIFAFNVSLQFVAIAVVGGLSSLGGAVAAGAVFAGLNEVFFRVSFLSGWLDLVSALLLTVVLLAYPGGLAAVPTTLRRLRERWVPVRARESALDARARAIAVRALALGREGLRAASAAMATTAKVAAPVLDPLKKRLPRRRKAPVALGRTRDWFAAANAPGEDEGARTPAKAQPSANGSTGPKPIVTFEGASPAAHRLPPRADRAIVLDARDVTVRFGGLTAVNDASLQVREGEITGLIGPNGAGKTTLFNAILGLNDPAAGEITLFGQDLRGSPPHERARAGIARTFQVLQLFGELTVFENVLVATHQHNDSNLLSNLAAGPRTLRAEDAARDRVRQVLRLLNLEEIADQGVRGLPFGTLRMVELGRALVTGAPLVMLDEPASGLNEAETDQLTEVIRGARSLGVSVLLIEHDVRMVTGVSDYMYVLNQGRMLTEGEPAEVQRHPEVIAAYLGEPVEEEAGVP